MKKETVLLKNVPVLMKRLDNTDVRLAAYPDGSQQVQVRSLYVVNDKLTPIWTDLPLVLVDENGVEIKESNGKGE